MGSCCSKKNEKKPVIRHRYHASKMKEPRVLKETLEAEPHIIIIGAGAAGLACAVELIKHDFRNVRVLEATNRLGGRIHTMTYADNTIDLGAQWVHGEYNNIVYQMVYDKDLLDSSVDLFNEIEWKRSSGDSLSQSVINQLANTMKLIVTRRHSDFMDYEGTFSEYVKEKLMENLQTQDNSEIDMETALDFLRVFLKMEGAAIDWGSGEMSTVNYNNYEPCCGDKLNWREKGFKQFLRVLVEGDEMNEDGILSGCITFNSKVMRIEWDRIDGTIMIYCRDKKVYVADHVVVTVSLGVLKKNLSLFVPRLPSDKCRAVNYTGFGHLCKIFLEFENSFWEKSWAGFNIVWTKNDLNEFSKTDVAWVTDIYGIYCTVYQPRVMQAWATGIYTEVIESLDSKVVAVGMKVVLKKFLPNISIPQPTRITTSKWSTDPSFMGSYSYPSTLTKTYNTGPEELAQPVNLLTIEPDMGSTISLIPMTVRPILLFAGEATSNNHYSTVHGAVETGIREAHRLAGYYFKTVRKE